MIEIRAFIPKERYKDVELPVVKWLTFVLYDDTFNIPENFTNTVFISANGLKYMKIWIRLMLFTS